MFQEVAALSGIGRVTHEARQVDAHALWLTWCKTTAHDEGAAPKRWVSVMDEAINRYGAITVSKWVSAAATQPVRPKDPQDFKRVLLMVTNAKYRAAALAAYEDGAEVIPQVSPESKSRPKHVVEACQLSSVHWSHIDTEAATRLMAALDPEQLIQLGDRTAAALGVESVTPSELLRFHQNPDKGGVKAGKRDSYGAGETERATTADIRFDLDPAAEKMFLKGADTGAIMEFHNQAPQGYWDAVEETGLAPEAAYEQLEKEFGWHPGGRA